MAYNQPYQFYIFAYSARRTFIRYMPIRQIHKEAGNYAMEERVEIWFLATKSNDDDPEPSQVTPFNPPSPSKQTGNWT